MTAFGFTASAPEPDEISNLHAEPHGSAALQTLTWASVAVAAAALGLYIGREIRVRYKFRRRTPYDFFSNAGNRRRAPENGGAEYGMGV